jgi:hypothetical protein
MIGMVYAPSIFRANLAWHSICFMRCKKNKKNPLRFFASPLMLKA